MRCLFSFVWLLTGLLAQAYLVGPPESLEEMTKKADLVCKAKVIATTGSGRACVSDLKLVTVFKGEPGTNQIRFLHNGLGSGNGMFTPQYYDLQLGRTYLLFALKDKSGSSYQQIRGHHTFKMDNGAMRTLDDRPFEGVPIKEAHWLELNLLLTNSTPQDALYAIEQLNSMTVRCDYTNGLHHPADWLKSRVDFEWTQVAPVLLQQVRHPNDAIAIAAINAFGYGCCPNATNGPAPVLVDQAKAPHSVGRRTAAMRALMGRPSAPFAASLPVWCADSSDEVRTTATFLAPSLPASEALPLLRQQAQDTAPNVRAAVAHVAGNGKIPELIPLLAKDNSPIVRATAAGAIGAGKFAEFVPLLATLLADPTGVTNKQVLQPTEYTSLMDQSGPVRSAAAYALLHFPPGQVDSLLRAHLNDDYFKPAFLARLAATNAEPWLDDLADVMERYLQVANWGQESRSGYPNPSHPYRECFMRLGEGLEKQSTDSLLAGKFDRHLNAWEAVRISGSQEPEDIYRLYVLKGLRDRARLYKEKVLKQRSGMESCFQRAERDAAQWKKLYYP